MSNLEHILRVRKLYKIIMRLHKGLPEELQHLGTNYARDEFKRHKTCQPHEANIFLNEWTDYAITLAKQLKPLEIAKKREVGKYINPSLIESMRDDQIAQLYELSKAALNKEDDERL